jgi:hypothetical protein
MPVRSIVLKGWIILYGNAFSTSFVKHYPFPKNYKIILVLFGTWSITIIPAYESKIITIKSLLFITIQKYLKTAGRFGSIYSVCGDGSSVQFLPRPVGDYANGSLFLYVPFGRLRARLHDLFRSPKAAMDSEKWEAIYQSQTKTYPSTHSGQADWEP